MAIKPLEVKRPPRGKIDPDLATAMALQGKSFTEIAKHFNVNVSSISRLLKDTKDTIRAFLAYRNNEADFIDFQKFQILTKGFSEDKIALASLRDQAIAFGTLHDKRQALKDDKASQTPLIQIILEANRDTVKHIESPNSVIDITQYRKEQQDNKCADTTQSMPQVLETKEEIGADGE